jgi:hypothetical protein
VLVGGFTYLRSYQPLLATSTASMWVSSPPAEDLGPFTAPSGEEFRAYRLYYQDGATVQVGFTLSNDGGLPVTIRRVGGNDVTRGPLRQVSVEIGTNASGTIYTFERKAPFRPFELAAGESRVVAITYRLERGCPLGRNDTTYNEKTYGKVAVEFGAFGLHRRVQLPLPVTLNVRTGSACPVG